MVSFRRFALAIAVLALCTGLATANVNSLVPINTGPPANNLAVVPGNTNGSLGGTLNYVVTTTTDEISLRANEINGFATDNIPINPAANAANANLVPNNAHTAIVPAAGAPNNNPNIEVNAPTNGARTRVPERNAVINTNNRTGSVNSTNFAAAATPEARARNGSSQDNSNNNGARPPNIMLILTMS